METKIDRVLQMVRERGMVRTSDLTAQGIERVYLQRLCERGLLERVGRGTYALSGTPISENHTLVQAAVRVPHGVICLLSALRYHRLTTQNPFDVWMAIDTGAHVPSPEDLPLRIVRFSGRSRSEGVECHLIEGVSVPMYNAPKTVADCFRFRNKIGLDVAIEALRDCRRLYQTSVSTFLHYAEVCKVFTVMRPYLEVLE